MRLYINQIILSLKLVKYLINKGFELNIKRINLKFNNLKLILLFILQKYGHLLFEQNLNKIKEFLDKWEIIYKI